jgi:hypothetical protein
VIIAVIVVGSHRPHHNMKEPGPTKDRAPLRRVGGRGG